MSSYTAKVLLGLRNIHFCPTCEKVILEGEELPENSPDNSICCDHCGAWFHFVCAQITHIEDDQEWFCQACLLDFVDRELDTTSLVDPWWPICIHFHGYQEHLGRCSPHVRESKTVMDSGFQSLQVELAFWILIVSGIPDCLSCIPYSKTQDSGFFSDLLIFCKQKFPGFRNLDSLTWGEGAIDLSLTWVFFKSTEDLPQIDVICMYTEKAKLTHLSSFSCFWRQNVPG